MTKKVTVYLLGENDYPNVPPIHVTSEVRYIDKLVAEIRRRHPAWDAETVAVRAVVRAGAAFLAKALENPHTGIDEDGALTSPSPTAAQPANGGQRGAAAAARLKTKL